MGNKGSKSKSKAKTSKIKTKDDKKESSVDEINYTQICDIGHKLPTPPLTMGSKLIFLSTNENKTVCSIYDLNKSEFTTRNEEIKCDNENFNVNHTVYTINPNTNKIYFIENNKDISTLDLTNFQLISLNKSITTTNKNKAQIIYNKSKDKIFIIGGEEKSDECDEYTIIPYSTATKKKGEDNYMSMIKKAGQLSRVINVKRNEKDYIYILGGQKDFSKGNESKSSIRPNDSIWTVTLTDAIGGHDWKSKTKVNDIRKNKKKHGKEQEYKYVVTEFHTQQPQHSFGIICYSDKYLICFGGEEDKRKKIVSSRYIWFLPLTNDDAKNGIEMDCWYEIYLRLPKKTHYHAVYPDNNKVNILHLFSYDGIYYTIEMKDIINKIINGECVPLHKWTEAGKTVLPTKSTSIRNVGPKIGNIKRVEDILEELDLDDYIKVFKEKGYIECKHVVDNADALKDIVEKEEELKAIIAKAKEVVDGQK
eukprot:70797_1